MAYTIPAIVFFISLGLMISTDYRSSFTDIKFKGKTYFRKSKPVCCKVKGLSWSRNGTAFVICGAENDKPEIELFIKNCSDEIPERIWLIESEIRNGKLYTAMPITVPANMPLQFHEKNNEKEITVAESERLSSNLKKIYIAMWILLVVSFLSIGVIPLISIALETAIIFTCLQNVPFRSWTKSNACGIIKENKVNVCNGNSRPDSTFPLGYDEWTDTEKELFDIESRVGAKAMVGEEFSEKKENWVESDEIVVDDFVEETRDVAIGSIVPRACHNCGCIVDNDAFFCSQCGERLESDKTPMSTDPVSRREIPQIHVTSTTENSTSNEHSALQQNSNGGEQNSNKKKNRRHRSRKANANGSNLELSSVLAAAEESQF